MSDEPDVQPNTRFYKMRYFAHRALSVDEAEAVERMVQEYPDFKRSVGDWEREWSRKQMSPMDVVRSDAKPEDVLKVLVQEEARARRVLEQASDQLDGKPFSEEMVAIWRVSFKAWSEISKRTQDQAEIVRRIELEVKETDEWSAEWQELVDGLRGEYTGKGPQYELLIESVADVMMRIRRLRKSERDVKSTEAYNWHAMLNNGVKRLQTYTESTKQEVTQKAVNIAIEEVLKIVENVVRPVAPEAWEGCVIDIRQYVKRKRAA